MVLRVRGFIRAPLGRMLAALVVMALPYLSGCYPGAGTGQSRSGARSLHLRKPDFGGTRPAYRLVEETGFLKVPVDLVVDVRQGLLRGLEAMRDLIAEGSHLQVPQLGAEGDRRA